MDAAASLKVDADVDDVYAFFLKIENTDFPTAIKQKSTVIKYTKLPEFDFESNGSWPQNSYTLQPRLRRIVTLEEPETNTTRSLKPKDPLLQHRAMATNLNKRKIVTITENDEYDLHHKFSKDSRKSNSLTSNRSNGSELQKEVRPVTNRTMSRITNSGKHLKDAKSGAKLNNVIDKNEDSYKLISKSRNSKYNQSVIENKSRNAKEKDTVKNNTKSVALSRTSLSKKSVTPSESDKDMSVIKSKLYDNLKSATPKKYIERSRIKRRTPSPEKTKSSFLLDMKKKKQSVPVIYVPLEEKKCKEDVIGETEIPSSSGKPTIVVYTKLDGSMDTKMILHKDMDTETEPLPKTENQLTDMEGFKPDIIYEYVESDVQTNLIGETFAQLEIPDVSLKKEKTERNDNLFDLHSKSLPNLQIPAIKITDNRNEKSFLDAHYCKSTSYVISRSTLTYRTKQKINFHVVGSKDNVYSNQSPSPLAYPMNVVSVFKEELSSKDDSNNISLDETHESKSSKEFKNCINEIKSFDCSYVPNSDKLMKPSDIISTIRVNNSLLQSVFMCEQFQRELNFIDSFFESLQYLENCSLSERCLKKDTFEELTSNPALLDAEFAVKNTEYNSFLSKLENGTNSDDTETMASKNIFLLNILIRDEQRRAKNLLYVLKRREDALKDFTKSQILYLENKKKQDNTDISALKKKQRGALLKLQHECGEMQRMRKALLTLSEKRKVALMKTKKDLELKLKNNVNVERIILGKKKLKRNTTVDRSSVPLKCFDLSSSGCEDSTTSQNTSEGAVPRNGDVPATSEKSIQTGDSIQETTLISRSTDTAAENFVVVDGGYLNILFHNLSLPQIFSGSKQYEVNEEAIKNIVDSTTSLRNENWNEIVEKLMNQVSDSELDKSSTPSTARSFVEEYEQYYRTLAEEDRSPIEEEEYKSLSKVHETSDAMVQTSSDKVQLCEIQSEPSTCTIVPERVESIDASVVLPVDDETECRFSQIDEAKDLTMCLNGPLPVPPGAADVPEDTAPDSWPSTKPSNNTLAESSSSSSQSACDLTSSVSSIAAPAHMEAEELRRQQLAIEREIKELEQQQCRLLVVREIPDKPPPPYTPPSEARAPKVPRLFQLGDGTEDSIRKYVADPNASLCDPTDAFEVLVHDFCKDTLESHRLEQGDKPWDSYNLLPQKPPLDAEKLAETVASELVEVLTPATPTVVSGVSSRRADHIDDILFSEWRRVEPEWTSLHSDEAIVKNQLFDTIFQRILTETVDEYKRTVLSPPPPEPDEPFL